MKCCRPLIALVGIALSSQFQAASAQQATVAANPQLAHVVNAQGLTPTDPSELLYRRGTNPLVPVTRSDGHHITLDEWDNATGQVHLAARPGGGTDVNIDLQGLFPGELYTVWVGYFQEPGFPTGTLIGFGAVGDGSDNVKLADANGAISFDLVLQEGPLSVQGEAPSYAPISPIVSNGVVKPHTGVEIALAYHFNNPPAAPFLNPGPTATWASQIHGSFAAVPEPSAIVLTIVAVVGSGAILRRRRT